MFRGTLDREVRLSRILVLGQESEILYHNVVITFKTNAAETTGKQEGKLFESNAQHLRINVVRRNIPKSWLKSTIMLHHA